MATLTKAQISIFHFLNSGITSPIAIHRKTQIPLTTIKYNLRKFKETKSFQCRGGNGCPRRISYADSVAISQYIRRNNEIILREFQEKLSVSHHTSVPISTISRHLHDHGYQTLLPLNTPMLTSGQKRYRVEWSKTRINDDWTRTVFTDESSFQLFRNTVRRWSKKRTEEVKRKPRNRQGVGVGVSS